MENAAKRKFLSRDCYQPQYNHNNQKLLIDNCTNTECQKPMMLNAWTQTETEDSAFKSQHSPSIVDSLQERIRKLEEMFNSQSFTLNELQRNQPQSQNGVTTTAATSTSTCINGKIIQQNESIRKSSPNKNHRQPEKTTYKIVAGPAGMEIIEPIEVEYAEEDGTYLDHDLNNSNDSNRLEICIPKEEYSSTNGDQQANDEVDSRRQHQQNGQNYTLTELGGHQQQHSMHAQENEHQMGNIQLQTVTHQQNGNNIHNGHTEVAQTPAGIYTTNFNNYASLTPLNGSQQMQQETLSLGTQSDNSGRNLQYFTVVHSNTIDTQQPLQSQKQQIIHQPQNVIITTQQQHHMQTQNRSPSISPMANSTGKTVNTRSRQKTDIRNFIGQEGGSTSTPVAESRQDSSSAARSAINIKKEFNDTAIATPPRPRLISAINNDVEVSLGPNDTTVPAAVYESIDWHSVTSATRKLLITAFDRETLATHTMTGKPSPAFKGRDLPSKQQLNPLIVQDIIYAVSHRCNVPEKEVRTAITTKCADENKMFKQREKRRRSLQESNKENLSKSSVTIID